jgi:thioredoxin reductase (NADPH)
MTELVIVGAGPAGIAAALWARAFELDALLLERGERVGGQLHRIHFEPSQLVTATGGTGPEMAALAGRRLVERGVPFRTGAMVEALLDPGPGVRLAGGERIEAHAVLVASGVRPRRLEVPGAERLEGAGVSYSATRDLERFAGRPVVVVGGGDAAFENALILARAGCKVTLGVRDAPVARPVFRKRVAADPAVEILLGVRLIEVRGDRRVEAVVFEHEGGRRLQRGCEGLVVKVGNLPNTEWCSGALELDRDGYLVTDPEGRTSRPGVWAAGDVTRPGLPAIPVAEAQAAMVVRAILRDLGGG